LEWLRLTRTRRLVALFAVYLFFGFTGPLTARYLSTILGRLGTEGVKVEFPPPTPADGIAQFTSNATQIGILVVVMVATSALAVDARREMAVFLRTRVRHIGQVILPAYTVNVGAAAAGLLAGTIAAWYETSVLLGPPRAVAMLAGSGYGVLFLAFVVALVALWAALARSVLATAGLTLAVLLALAVLGSLPRMARWLPTSLAGAVAALARGGQVSDYLPAAGVAVAVTIAALAGAVALSQRHEI
jgi:ABC-2 type transport system permease protein